MGATDFTGPFKIGDLIRDEYEVRGLLGAGGHAFVYECLDRYMDAVVAVKVIATLPGRGRELLDRAHAEAKLLFRLNHPNVVRVMTARPAGDSMVCIVMEKLEGLSLRQFLKLHGRLTVTESLVIVRQIAEGVGAAHQLDVIHRDIKPENVFLLPPNNQVKVLDFGIAKFIGHGFETTNKARIHGTPLYMSPEHLQNTSVTVRSDIYELGTLAFELMTGKIPCLVDLENPDFNQLAYVQISKVTPSLTRLISDVGPMTEYLVQRSTAKEPAQRFASMSEVIAAVDAAMAEQRSLYPREWDSQRLLNDEVIRHAQAVAQEDDLSSQDEKGNVVDGTRKAVVEAAASTRERKGTGTSADTEQRPLRQPVMAPTVEHVRPDAMTKGSGGSHGLLTQIPLPAEPATTNSATTASINSNSDSQQNRMPLSGTSLEADAPRVRRSVLVLPVALGLLVAVAVSWEDIQRYQARQAGSGANVVSQPAPTLALQPNPPPSSQPLVLEPPRSPPLVASIATYAAPSSHVEITSTAASSQQGHSAKGPTTIDGENHFSADHFSPSASPRKGTKAATPKRAFASNLDGKVVTEPQSRRPNPSIP